MTKSTKEVNILEFVQHLAKGRLEWPSKEGRWLGAGIPSPAPDSLPSPVEDQALLESSSSSTPSFLSFVIFSAFFAIREEVSSEDTAICNIWKKIKSLLFIRTAFPPAKSLWYNLDNETSTAFVSMSIQKSSHQWLALLKKSLILQSNIFIDTHTEWLGSL